MPASTPTVHADMDMSTKEAQEFMAPYDDKEHTVPTFWAWEHKPHAPFGFEHALIEAMGGNPVAFNSSDVKFRIPPAADGVWKGAFAAQLPGLVGVYRDEEGELRVARGADQPHWVNFAALNLIKSTKLYTADGTELLSRPREADFVKEVCNTPSDRAMPVGSFAFLTPEGDDDVAALQAHSRAPRTVYRELGFSHNDFTGLVFRNAAVYLAKAGYQVDFEAKEKMVRVPEGAPKMTVCVRPRGATDADIEAGRVRVAELSDNDLKCRLELKVVILTEPERDEWTKKAFTQIVSDVKMYRKKVNAPAVGEFDDATLEYEYRLMGSHVTTHYSVLARPSAKDKANQPFHFWGSRDAESGLVEPPIRSMGIDFNNSERLKPREAAYFTNWEHRQHSACVPPRNIPIYGYHLCVDPQAPDHTGGPDHKIIEGVNFRMLIESSCFRTSSFVEVFVLLWGMAAIRYCAGGLRRKHQAM